MPDAALEIAEVQRAVGDRVGFTRVVGHPERAGVCDIENRGDVVDEAARLLDQEMKTLGAKADFFWMEGRTHGNIDRIGDDPNGLEKKIAWEMYAAARPASKLKSKEFLAPAAPAAAPATAGQ